VSEVYAERAVCKARNADDGAAVIALEPRNNFCVGLGPVIPFPPEPPVLDRTEPKTWRSRAHRDCAFSLRSHRDCAFLCGSQVEKSPRALGGLGYVRQRGRIFAQMVTR
jgi:hypothetical protein